MLLLPAHTRDAKEMARRLCDALEYHNLVADCREPESDFLTLQQTQEVMAKAMGHASWRELIALLKAPHEPVYIDGSAQSALTEFVEKLAALLGYDYAHGFVYRVVAMSGAGFSPRTRRAIEENNSPWGPIDESEEIAPGIVSVTTSGHGGLMLSEERQKAMPNHLRLDRAGYEEDGEYNLVAFAFPDEAESMGMPLIDALEYVEVLSQEHGKDLTESELEVISYLSECVRTNRRPVLYPKSSERLPDDGDLPEFCFVPTLRDWVETLSKAPRVDGRWPSLAGPWHEHWTLTVREDERQAAREAYDRKLFAAFQPDKD